MKEVAVTIELSGEIDGKDSPLKVLVHGTNFPGDTLHLAPRPSK